MNQLQGGGPASATMVSSPQLEPQHWKKQGDGFGLGWLESVENFKFLGVHISADFTWSTHITHQQQQRLDFLRKLHQALLPQKLFTNFYRSTTESLLTYCCPPQRHLHQQISEESQRNHPGHSLFTLLPSGRHYRTLKVKTNRLKNRFFSPSCKCLLLSLWMTILHTYK